MIGFLTIPGGWEFILVWLFLVILPLWRICSKASYPGAISLLILVPLINILFIYYLAFVEWPIEKRLAPYEPKRAT